MKPLSDIVLISTEMFMKLYQEVWNLPDIFCIGVPQASRRVLRPEGRPEISEVESILHFHGGYEQIAIYELVSYFARVGPLI